MNRTVARRLSYRHLNEGGIVLNTGRVATRLPAEDLDRARRFYAEKLGLDPVDERPGGLLYRGASGEFALFESMGASPGTFTQMGWEVNMLGIGQLVR
jgi:catechol 2,3-dioxygenase-like lactoylglutathione lyase family enzyme